MFSTSTISCALMLAVLGPSPLGAAPAAATGSSSDPPLAQVAQADTAPIRWTVVGPESRARYLVREQLAGFDFPNDAVGETDQILGFLVMAADGSLVTDESSFTVDLTTLKTDNERRDGYVHRRTLETELFPEAVLVPREFRGLPSPLPSSGTLSFQLAGDLTLHGVTRATVWEVIAQFGPESITGQATTSFPFETFGIEV
ncbi:YceI family protein, partial [Gemmatimonadota bacterium]